MGLEIGITSLGLEERIEFFRTLSSWLVSGEGTMPVNESIKNTCDVFSRDEFVTLRARMDRIVREYNSGQVSFVAALRGSKLGFTAQELSIVDAAEKSNQLRIAIPSLVEALEMRRNANKMLKGKMAMPLIGGFMLILLSLGVMVFMLPTVMGPVVERSENALDDFPMIIQAYWAASVWLRGNYVITILFSVMPLIIFLVRNTAFMQRRIEKILMGMSVTRRIIVAFNGVLIVYFMPALVRANMPLPEVLKTLAGSLDNMMIAGLLRKAALDHENGYKLGDVLAPLPLRGSFRSAVEAGEKTGKIAERVEDLKSPYTNEFERVVKKAVGTLTFIVMAVLMPFFIISVYTSLVTPMIALMEYS